VINLQTMNSIRFLSSFLAFLAFGAAAVTAAPDSVKVIDHSVAGFKSVPSLRHPDTFLITLEVEYALTSKPKAVLKLALDHDKEMDFAIVDQKDVTADRKKRKIELKARLEKFTRDMLRGVVVLQDPDAAAGAPPLAMNGVSLKMKKFREF